MGEALDSGDERLSARFEAVKAEIMSFRPREPHEHPDLLGGEAAIPFERILVGVARGREAIDLALGEGLTALEDRDLLMDLGYSRMEDYAREELGLPPGTARDKARLARELGTRPLLRQAVLSGRVAPRRAREVVPVARAEAEEAWVALAATMTVRELNQTVERALGDRAGAAPGTASPAPDEERWRVSSLEVPPEFRVVVDEAMKLAEEALWRGAPPWLRVEALSDEFLGGYGEGDEPSGPAQGAISAAQGAIPAEEASIPPGDLEKALEIESDEWSWLEAVEPVAAPEVREVGAEALDARLKDLAGKRVGWDELFGRLAQVFVKKGMARQLGYANLGHWVKERLGMSRRAFEQRVWLEKRMEALPQLRHALRRGEVSYQQARLVAGVADFDSVNGWIRKAAGMTCIELARAIGGAEDAQMCAKGKFQVRMPESVARLMEAALRRAAEVCGKELTPGECLTLLACHFVQTWGPLLWGRGPPSRVRRRDGGFCTVPGCSRPWGADHHLVFRSHGGGDDDGNLTGMCAPHHLRGIHGGRLRVSGTAPDRLVWELANGKPFTAGRGRVRRRQG